MEPKINASSGKKPKKKDKNKQFVVKYVKITVKIFMILFVFMGCAGIGIGSGALYAYISTAAPISKDDLNLTENLTTFIYDETGRNEIARLTGFDNTDRILVFDREGQIPQHLKNAFVAIEDERFYQHNGVDIKRTLGAVLNYIKPMGEDYGGSTITQQLIKNITGDKEHSIKRKVQEQWKAIQLEKRLDKWQILELYMNLIYFGNGSYGIQSASYKYFGKPVKELTLAESASLAGISNNPVLYNPFTSEGRERNKERQELVLKKMLENEFITQVEYNEAMKKGVMFAEKSINAAKSTSVRPYFVDQVIKDVLRDLEAIGMDRQFAELKLYSGGLKIFTTMDLGIQSGMDEVFKDMDNFPGGVKQGFSPQAGMVIIDANTGEVKAMYGGSGEKSADMVFNRATQARRSAGSSFKPIADYAPALDQHLITAGTVIDDIPVYMMGVKKGRYPENSPETINGVFGRQYRGLINIRTAISRSINVAAAKVWKDYLGPDLSFGYLKKSGIDMKDEDRNLSIALGGLKYGVSPMQMAAAYVPFANKGMYFEPITHSVVKDHDGNILLDKRKTAVIKQKSNIVYDERTAFIMTDLLKSVTGLGGTASYVKLKSWDGKLIPTAGKTGTTDDNVDRWFLGYTTHYVGAVWYGYDKQLTVELSSGSQNPSAVIWMKVMQAAYNKKKLESKDLPFPAGLVKKEICEYSGKAPIDLCSGDPRGNHVRTEYFIKGTEPKGDELCDIHVAAKVDTSSKDIYGRPLPATKYTPPQFIEERVFILRKVPYTPVIPGDPYPLDWKYEFPSEYSNLYGSPEPDTGSPEVPVPVGSGQEVVKEIQQ